MTVDSPAAQMPIVQPSMDSTPQSMPSAVEPSEKEALMGPLQILFSGLVAGVAIGVGITKKWMNDRLKMERAAAGLLHGAEDNLELGALRSRQAAVEMNA